jgi:LPS sulfotransferase NodH
MQRHTLYLLCTTSRTGSTHLCQLLTSTGRLGSPDEYFNQPQMSQAMQQHRITQEQDYVQHILTTTSTPNGVCGIKLATDAFARLRSACHDQLAELSPKYIWLQRRDVLRQAISLYRAQETGVWHWPAGESRPTADAAFDADRIRECEMQIAAANEEWSGWFAAAKVEPLQLWYEDVALSPPAAIRAIADSVNVQCGAQDIVSHLNVLRDARTEAWVRQLQPSRSKVATSAKKAGY